MLQQGQQRRVNEENGAHASIDIAVTADEPHNAEHTKLIFIMHPGGQVQIFTSLRSLGLPDATGHRVALQRTGAEP